MVDLSLESRSLAVRLSPSSGGRITSLVDRDTGDDWIYSAARTAELGPDSLYVSGPRGGFDECLPSVSACRHPHPDWQHTVVRDHGDLWTIEWDVVQYSGCQVTLRAAAPDHPLVLTRSLELHATQHVLTLTYELANRSSHEYPFIYSAHPLLAFTGDAHLQLPRGARVVSAFGRTLIPGSRSRWPYAPAPDGSTRNLAVISRLGTSENYKVFVRSSGTCALTMAGRSKRLVLHHDTQALPWIGICVNRGAWPTPADGEHWIALEPTTSPTDDLREAVRSGEARTLRPGERSQWKLLARLGPLRSRNSPHAEGVSHRG